MKADFSRDSFDPGRHFTRVRAAAAGAGVLTDADCNEQAAIQQHFLRALVVDLVGRRWRVGERFAWPAVAQATVGQYLAAMERQAARITRKGQAEC